jgi:serine/threonine-protein kinase
MTDKAIGTVYYISPEQASGHPIDARSDLYSLGVLMYEMGCARLPFDADSPVSVALMQVNEKAQPPRKVNNALPIGLEQIIMRAMEKNPVDRYQNAKEMLKHLLRLKENPHIVFREVRKAKPRKPHRASHTMLPIILGVTLAFLGVAAVSGAYAISAIFLNNTTQKAETIKVVDFVGKTYSTQLEDWFNKSEYYTLGAPEYKYDPDHPAGTIIAQEPRGGEHRKVTPGQQRCTVTLTISRGAETFHLPDVVMYDYREASTLLKKMDLTVRVERIYSETFEVGAVVSTEPEATTLMKKGDTVIIYASQGPAVGTVVVPQFLDQNEVQTLRKVLSAGLQVGTVTYQQSNKPAGTILSQDIAAFKVVHANTKISFVVSGGPDYLSDPFPEDPFDTTPPTDPDDPYANWEPEEGFGDTPETEDPFSWLDIFLNRD